MGRTADVNLYHHLRSQIPRLHLTSIILRIASLILIATLSIFYALSGPEVFFDYVIWTPSETNSPPYNITIHRNLTPNWDPSEHASSIGQGMQDLYKYSGGDGKYKTMIATWMEKGPPRKLGLTKEMDCGGSLLEGGICKKGQVVATRIAWLDSWPHLKMPKWVVQMVHLDRYIFWTLVIGGALAMGHLVTVLVHSLEPATIGFLKYCGTIDFFLSTIFLLLGIFPLSILAHYENVLPNAVGVPKGQNGLGDIIWDLEPTEKYAFVMGWVLWALFFVSGILDFLLAGALRQYQDIRPKITISGDKVLFNEAGRTQMGGGAFQIPVEAMATTTGYADGKEETAGGSTESRTAGRQMASGVNAGDGVVDV